MKFNRRNKLLIAFSGMLGLTIAVSVIALISESSTQATVETMDDIAAQTNRLALNAAVEAYFSGSSVAGGINSDITGA